PEQQRTEMAKIFGSAGFGGRGGQGGGRTGGRNNGQQVGGPGIADRGATTIDALLPPVVRREQGNQRVWVYMNGTLKPINGVRTGISDGTFTELVTGEIKEGDKIVTNFVIPGAKATTTAPQQGNPFQQQGGRGGPGGGGGGRGGF
nr:hypothetical protein [Acidobacteriota bacterium]